MTDEQMDKLVTLLEKISDQLDEIKSKLDHIVVNTMDLEDYLSDIANSLD